MRLALTSIAAALLVAGCAAASGSADQAALARATLRQDVYKLTALAAAGRYVPARGWLQQVEQDMMYARASGAIGLAQEDRIAAMLQLVRGDLATQIAALSTPSGAPSSSVSPAHRAPSRAVARATSAAATSAAPQAAPVRHTAEPTQHKRRWQPRHHRKHRHHHHRHRHHRSG